MHVTEYHRNEEKIFSRNRIRIPKISGFRFENKSNNGKKNIAFKICVILIVEIVVARFLINGLKPVVYELCSSEAKRIATCVSNKQASIVMEKYSYEDLATVVRDESGKIQMVKLNVVPVNKIISEVTLGIQESFSDEENSSFNLRLGSFSGTKLLAGRGPNIKVKVSTVGNIETDLKSEFKTAGINQTLHQIYLEVRCNVCILTPYDCINEEIKNEILIAESIIVGDIPNSYYNFNGVDGKDTLQIIE